MELCGNNRALMECISCLPCLYPLHFEFHGFAHTSRATRRNNTLKQNEKKGNVMIISKVLLFSGCISLLKKMLYSSIKQDLWQAVCSLQTKFIFIGMCLQLVIFIRLLTYLQIFITQIHIVSTHTHPLPPPTTTTNLHSDLASLKA